MKQHLIPYCGKYESDFPLPDSQCRHCQYGDYMDGDDDGYCNYWDIHSPYECPDCEGTGYSFDGGQCDRCNGTGEVGGNYESDFFV